MVLAILYHLRGLKSFKGEGFELPDSIINEISPAHSNPMATYIRVWHLKNTDVSRLIRMPISRLCSPGSVTLSMHSQDILRFRSTAIRSIM